MRLLNGIKGVGVKQPGLVSLFEEEWIGHRAMDQPIGALPFDEEMPDPRAKPVGRHILQLTEKIRKIVKKSLTLCYIRPSVGQVAQFFSEIYS